MVHRSRCARRRRSWICRRADSGRIRGRSRRVDGRHTGGGLRPAMRRIWFSVVFPRVASVLMLVHPRFFSCQIGGSERPVLAFQCARKTTYVARTAYVASRGRILSGTTPCRVENGLSDTSPLGAGAELTRRHLFCWQGALLITSSSSPLAPRKTRGRRWPVYGSVDRCGRHGSREASCAGSGREPSAGSSSRSCRPRRP